MVVSAESFAHNLYSTVSAVGAVQSASWGKATFKTRVCSLFVVFSSLSLPVSSVLFPKLASYSAH